MPTSQETLATAAKVAPYALADEAARLRNRLSPVEAVKDSGVNLTITLAVMIGSSLAGLDPSVLAIATLSGLTTGDLVRAARRSHRLSIIANYG